MTVADIDALLYSAEHPIEALRRAARIPALSPGWQSSMKSLLVAAGEGGRTGNAGLTQAPPAPLSWSGFRCVNVIASSRENADVRSFELGAKDGTPLPPSLPGQHIVVRLRPNPDAPPVARNYSLCGALNAGTYRIAVKNEGGARERLSSRPHSGWRQFGDQCATGLPHARSWNDAYRAAQRWRGGHADARHVVWSSCGRRYGAA